ncbi:hypothetical protein [Bacillus sp. MUM 13]|uniref:hypothetical protein n=1 Tax=Bacillus sp. MUM 13 TaxID=1678001 RepID=UPI0008F56A0B|nr:hypothetical protein [Bacillus sp. MUM 13]OIK12328.1 hypothetical protein BIV59_09395 [Bacillus sp. MUM 13]
MNNKASAEEILCLIAAISDSLDELEQSIDETINTERCRLWSNQYKMVHSAQQQLERIEEKWNTKEDIISQSYLMKKEKSGNHPLLANPKLGF